MNGSSLFERLKGVFSHSEDFHCMMNFVNRIFTKFYDTQRIKDVVTLYCTSYETNWTVEMLGRIQVNIIVLAVAILFSIISLMAILLHFNMQDIDDEAAIPGMTKSAEADWFHEEVLRPVDKYVLQLTEAKQDTINFLQALQSQQPVTEIPLSLTLSISCSSLYIVIPLLRMPVMNLNQLKLVIQGSHLTETCQAKLDNYRSGLWGLLGRLRMLQYQHPVHQGLHAQSGATHCSIRLRYNLLN